MQRAAMVLALCAGLAIAGAMASAQAVGTYAFVDAQALNLRTGPTTAASVVRTLPRRTIVSILERRGTWARVYVQGASAGSGKGWLSARFLGRPAETIAGLRSRGYGGQISDPAPSYPQNAAGPLRVSKLDFDCRPALFGNSGIRKCVASVRVQLARADYDPTRSDSIPVACRGEISYRTESNRHSERMLAVARESIARDDRLGRSVRVDFDVRAIRQKVLFARLRSFYCAAD